MDEKNKIPEVLYHYTSVDVLHKILTNVKAIDPNNCSAGCCIKLHATHVSFLNDKTEDSLLSEALQEQGISYETIFISTACQGYPFVISLSDLPNDLNMWRCYGDGGRGVCIAFETEKMNFLNSRFEFKKCNYITKDKLKKRTVDIVKKCKSNDITELSRLLLDSPMYKHKAFKAEREWRLINNTVPEKFRKKENVIIPFIELRVPLTAIESITFGPKCDYDKNSFAFKRMLHNYCDGKDISFKQSDIPLD